MGGLVNRAVNAVAGKEKNILSLANSILKLKKQKKIMMMMIKEQKG